MPSRRRILILFPDRCQVSWETTYFFLSAQEINVVYAIY